MLNSKLGLSYAADWRMRSGADRQAVQRGTGSRNFCNDVALRRPSAYPAAARNISAYRRTSAFQCCATRCDACEYRVLRSRSEDSVDDRRMT